MRKGKDKMKNNAQSPFKNNNDLISSISDACGGGGVRYVTRKEKASAPFPLITIITVVFATVLFLFMVLTFMRISAITTDISKLRSEISELEGDASTLRGQIDYKYTKSQIEETSELLGLNSGKNTTVYFESENSSEVSQVIETETALGSTINTLLGVISKNFNKFIEFLN